MRRFIFLLVLLTLPVFSQAKHPFTFEDMMKLKRVGEPVPSPDGKWVLFAAVDVDLAANKKTSHIWIVPLEGGRERELIADQDGDRPRWAPDGKRFAFISTKEGGSQVWIAEFDGTSGTVKGARKLTSIATEAGGELWSPDGGNILFTSDVYPECDSAPDVQACNAKRVKEAKDSKVRALIFDRLLYRHWNAYKEGKRTHIFVEPIFEIPPAGRSMGDHPASIPRDLTPGDYDAPPFSLGGQDDYAFSPDGREICYTSNHDKVEATSTNNDLWIVPVSGGTAKNITADNPASDSTPLYSPDGKWIAYRAQERPGYESDRFRLMRYDRNTGEKKSLADALDRWVGTFTWAPDSTLLYFVADSKGDAPIYQVDVFTGHGRVALHPEGYADDLAVVAGGKILLFTQMSVAYPNQIRKYEATKDIAESERVADLNIEVLSEVAMSHLESFWFPGAFGEQVQGFLLRPPNFDTNKNYPLKFIIHGGPEVPMGNLWSYRWNAELFAASGYVVIMINFHGSPGYGQKFIDEIQGDWGGAPFEDLMKGLDYAEKNFPFIDKKRECALGASYGGYMANWVLGHTDRFKCIVTHDGMFNTFSAWGTTEELWFNDWEFKGTPYTNPEMYEKWNPRNAAKNFKTPTLVIHGQLDYRLDLSEGLQLFTTLQVLGVPSKMLYFPDEGHWVLKPQNSQLWYKTVNDWVDQWTK
jgi:dipeptidyl aminopeptidase/acylaminoacyl peptidase